MRRRSLRSRRQEVWRLLPAEGVLPAHLLVRGRLLPQANAVPGVPLRSDLLRRLLPQADAVPRVPLRSDVLRRLLPQTVPASLLPANAAEPVVVARPEVLLAVRSRAAVRLEFREEVDGITTRFFPTLERAAASALGVAFKRFEQAVQNDDETDAAAALTDARAALTAETASPADVDALNRAIDAMAAAFDATSDPHSPGEAQ